MARNQIRITRDIARVPVIPGGFQTIELPRQYDLESVQLRLSGSLQVTGAATAVRAESPTQLIQRIEITADGKNSIYTAPFSFATFASMRGRPSQQYGSRQVTPPSGTGVATYAVEAIGSIDCSLLNGVRPKDTNFPTRGLSLWQMRLQFGQAGDAFVGGTVAISGTMYVDVSVTEILEVADESGKVTAPGAIKKTSFQRVNLSASNAQQEVRLPAGNTIAAVTVRTEGAVTAGEPSVVQLNKLTLANQQDVRFIMTGGNLRAKNNQDYGYVMPGYYIADLGAPGFAQFRISEGWDVRASAEPKAILDVNGSPNGMADIVTEELILL